MKTQFWSRFLVRKWWNPLWVLKFGGRFLMHLLFYAVIYVHPQSNSDDVAVMVGSDGCTILRSYDWSYDFTIDPIKLRSDKLFIGRIVRSYNQYRGFNNIVWGCPNIDSWIETHNFLLKLDNLPPIYVIICIYMP